jgi:hypothetical protein
MQSISGSILLFISHNIQFKSCHIILDTVFICKFMYIHKNTNRKVHGKLTVLSWQWWVQNQRTQYSRMHVYVHVSLEFSSKQSIGPYNIVFDSVMAMQHSCMCEFGNGSQRNVSEWKKIHVWVKHQCKTATLPDSTKPCIQRTLQNLMHASDVFKWPTLNWFCNDTCPTTERVMRTRD